LVAKNTTISGLGLCGKFNRLENQKFIRSLDFLFLLYQDKRKAKKQKTASAPTQKPNPILRSDGKKSS